MKADGTRDARFIVTREHRRFVEFADAVRKHRYIGLCYGAAGVGKTQSARRYARWHIAGEMIEEWGPRKPSDDQVRAALARSRTMFYTPSVGGTFSELRQELPRSINRIDMEVDYHLRPTDGPYIVAGGRRIHHVQLLIVDEAERLSNSALDFVRDMFDRRGIGIILIGMPGIERRMERYPQLYSRVGFAHHYRLLSDEELAFVLSRRWRQLGLELDRADFTDAQALASIVRITRGNFRLLQRLFVQIERVMKINDLSAITDDVVEAARSTLVIGAT